MTEQIAEALSKLDDPQAIAKLLEATQDESQSLEITTTGSSKTDLDDLYERYRGRRQNRSPATRAQYKRTVPTFIDFAEDQGVTTTDGLSISLVDSFVDRLQQCHSADATVLTYTKNVRAWLRWLSKRGECSDRVCQLLDPDELGLTPRARDEALPASEASAILEQLRQRRYGSMIHALLELTWNGGMRIGGVHSLDLQDFDPDNRELQIRHRLESGTRLKNGSEDKNTPGDGERNITLAASVIEAVSVYIETERPAVTDEYGREPLFTTPYGRAARSTIRRKLYQATSCRWGPESREKQDCDGSCDPDSDVCSYSYFPHAIRRGAIVRHLSGGLSPSIASERFDVSVQTLKKHYDPRTKRRRKEDRSESVKDAW